MPSPISHIFHGEAFIKRHPVADDGAFLRGTVFPDIRFLTGMDRSLTHRLGVVISDVIDEKDSWRAGWLFHNWLDVAWADYFTQYGLDPLGHEFDSKYGALKLFEDDLLHDHLGAKQCESLAAHFQGEDAIELTFGVTAKDAAQWNKLILELLKSRDSLAAREHLLRSTHVSNRAIEALERHDKDLHDEGVWPSRLAACRQAIDDMY